MDNEKKVWICHKSCEWPEAHYHHPDCGWRGKDLFANDIIALNKVLQQQLDDSRQLARYLMKKLLDGTDMEEVRTELHNLPESHWIWHA